MRGPAFPSGAPEAGAVGIAPAQCVAANQARVAGTGSRAPGSRGTTGVPPAGLACPAGCPRSGSRPWVSAGRREQRPRKAGVGLGGPGTLERVFLAARPPARRHCLVHLPPASAFAHSLPSTCSICLDPRFPAASCVCLWARLWVSESPLKVFSIPVCDGYYLYLYVSTCPFSPPPPFFFPVSVIYSFSKPLLMHPTHSTSLCAGAWGLGMDHT